MSEFGGNSKFWGVIHKIHALSISCFLKRGTLAGLSGAPAAEGRRILKILQFLKGNCNIILKKVAKLIKRFISFRRLSEFMKSNRNFYDFLNALVKPVNEMFSKNNLIFQRNFIGESHSGEAHSSFEILAKIFVGSLIFGK